MKKYDLIYDSKNRSMDARLTFADEGTMPLTILFEDEGIVVQADANGEVSFSALDGMLLYHEVVERNDRYFSKLSCGKWQGKIRIQLIHVRYVDNYPHCDGEHDRYDEIDADSTAVFFPL